MTQNKNQNIIYLDANNLYGYAMSKFQMDISKMFNLNKYTSNSSKVCIIEVDLEYPKELRELHNDYPLAPEKIKNQTRNAV